MKEHSYMAFLQEAKQFIPQERIYTDELRRLAWGTDAGFYRLIPQIVIRSKDEDEGCPSPSERQGPVCRAKPLVTPSSS